MSGPERLKAFEVWLAAHPRPKPTLPLVEVKPTPPPPPPLPPDAQPDAVVTRCLVVLGVSMSGLVGSERLYPLVEAREVISAILRAYEPQGKVLSFPEIAKLVRLNPRGHSTIITGLYRWSQQYGKLLKAQRVAEAAGLPEYVQDNLDTVFRRTGAAFTEMLSRSDLPVVCDLVKDRLQPVESGCCTHYG